MTKVADAFGDTKYKKTLPYITLVEPNRGTVEYGKAGRGINQYTKIVSKTKTKNKFRFGGPFSKPKSCNVSVAASGVLLCQKVGLGGSKDVRRDPGRLKYM